MKVKCVGDIMSGDLMMSRDLDLREKLLIAPEGIKWLKHLRGAAFLPDLVSLRTAPIAAVPSKRDV